MTATDLERHLVSLAVHPPVDAEHREALAARLQQRFRTRRRRRRTVLALAVFVLFSGVMVRQTAVVSYGFRYGNVLTRDGHLFLSRYRDDKNVYSLHTDSTMSPADLTAAMEKAGVVDALHLAGRDRLVRLFGIEQGNRRYLIASYLATVAGESVTTGYSLANDLNGEFLTLARSGQMRLIMAAARNQLLPRLPDSLAVVDGIPVRIQRWLAHAPAVGDFVLLRGAPVGANDPGGAGTPGH